MSALHPVPRSEVLFYQHLGLPTPSLGLFTIFVSESKVGWFVSMSRTCTLNWLHVLNPGRMAGSLSDPRLSLQKKTTGCPVGPVQHVLYQNLPEVSENHICLRFLKIPCGLPMYHLAPPAGRCSRAPTPHFQSAALKLLVFFKQDKTCGIWDLSMKMGLKHQTLGSPSGLRFNS
jgi:hypothetical protein